MRRPGRQRGQAVVELLAMIPVIVLAALLAWQLAAVLGAGMRAQERVRADALRAASAPGRTTAVIAAVEVPRVLPGVGRMTVRARARVRTP